MVIDPDRLPMWVIYDHPMDFPDHWVARLWHSLPEPAATDLIILSPIKDALQAYFAGCGFRRLGRSPGDDAKIVESWVC